jgi:S1-C subfamily serine protease
MSVDTWYVRKLGRVTGPFNMSQLESLSRRGQLAQFHEVSQDGRTWVSAKALPELFAGSGDDGVSSPHVPPQPTEPIAPIAAGEWYYSEGQSPLGPLEARQIAVLVQSGRIHSATQVWKKGLPTWQALRDVPELAGLLTAPTVPPSGPSSGLPVEDAPRSTEDSPHRPRVVALVALGAGLLLVAVVVTAIVVLRNRKTQDESVVGGGGGTMLATSNAAHVIDGPYSKYLADAVGFVVCGWTVETNTGDVFDEIASSGSCFAVNSKGLLLTNKHVVDDTQTRQRKSEELAKQDYADWINETLEEKRAKVIDEEVSKLPEDPQERQRYREERKKALKKEVSDKVVALVKKLVPTVWVFFSKEKCVAKILYTSDSFDLAVLKVDRGNGAYFDLVLEDESRFQKGRPVYAIGFPAASRQALTVEAAIRQELNKSEHKRVENYFEETAFDYTITDGIVSRVHVDDDKQKTKKIHHGAMISAGNSGGPLIDKTGAVVGINTWVRQATSQGQLVQNYYALCLPQTLRELRREVSNKFPDK